MKMMNLIYLIKTTIVFYSRPFEEWLKDHDAYKRAEEYFLFFKQNYENDLAKISLLMYVYLYKKMTYKVQCGQHKLLTSLNMKIDVFMKEISADIDTINFPQYMGMLPVIISNQNSLNVMTLMEHYKIKSTQLFQMSCPRHEMIEALMMDCISPKLFFLDQFYDSINWDCYYQKTLAIKIVISNLNNITQKSYSKIRAIVINLENYYSQDSLLKMIIEMRLPYQILFGFVKNQGSCLKFLYCFPVEYFLKITQAFNKEDIEFVRDFFRFSPDFFIQKSLFKLKNLFSLLFRLSSIEEIIHVFNFYRIDFIQSEFKDIYGMCMGNITIYNDAWRQMSCYLGCRELMPTMIPSNYHRSKETNNKDDYSASSANLPG